MAVRIPKLQPSDLRGNVDVAILTIRDDEEAAVLDRLPIAGICEDVPCSISDVPCDGGYYRVAITRSLRQGTNEAQKVTETLIRTLAPSWIIAVGIAGGVADSEFSLGDVILADRVYDLSVTAAKGRIEEYSPAGGGVHPRVEKLLAGLRARQPELAGWNSKAALRVNAPDFDLTSAKTYGDHDSRTDVMRALKARFEGKKRPPLFTVRPIISGSRLMQDTAKVKLWRRFFRHFAAIEMEFGGVYIAAKGRGEIEDTDVPVLTIRGISDIVGLKRTGLGNWTNFARNSAASLTKSLLEGRFFGNPRPMRTRLTSRSSAGIKPKGEVNRDQVLRPMEQNRKVRENIQRGTKERAVSASRRAAQDLPGRLYQRHVAVCFVDIRDFGEFSKLSGGHIDYVLSGFLKILKSALAKASESVPGRSHFARWVQTAARNLTVKPLGPGAMIVWEYPDEHAGPREEIGLALLILDFVRILQERFEMEMRQLQTLYNLRRLELGIGLSRGLAWRVEGPNNQATDYVGEAIKLSARLKDKARPYGLVADLAFAPSIFMERSCAQEGSICQESLDSSNETIPVWKVPTVRRRRVGNPNTLQGALKLLRQYRNSESGPMRLVEDDTWMMFEARETLEAKFAEDFARHISEDSSRPTSDRRISVKTFSPMENTLREMERMLEDGTIPRTLPSPYWSPPEQWSRLGVKFHAEIARLSDANEGEDRRIFTEEIYRFTRQSYSAATTREELENVVLEHGQILTAIKNGHVLEASSRMMSHLSGHYEREQTALLKKALLVINDVVLPLRKTTTSEKFDLSGTISSIAKQGVALVEDAGLREALRAAYDSPQSVKAVETAQRVFKRLSQFRWRLETLCDFLSGWRSTHGTALFVSGLMVRMHREAAQTQRPNQALLYRAISELGEVISEDTGLATTPGLADAPHNELFAEFANFIADDSDQWLLGTHVQQKCEHFRSYIKRQRLIRPIEDGLLTTAASENWNSGEYTYFNGMVLPWVTRILEKDGAEAKKKVEYIDIHAGNTELSHFLHALDAWKLYCRATNKKADPTKAGEAFIDYFEAIGSAFGELDLLLAGATPISN